MRRRFPSRRQIRARELGADELQNRLEWKFRTRPRKLRAIRRRHMLYCTELLGTLERKMADASGARQKPVINVDAIPKDLRALRNWVVWKWASDKNGRPTKIPYDAKTGRPAKSNNPSTWADFETALRAVHQYSGLGINVTAPLICTDLDGVRNPTTGAIEPWASEQIRLLNSFTEISPSNTGLHVWTRGRLPAGNHQFGHTIRGHKQACEFYANLRYICTSGTHLAGSPATIEERDTLAAYVFGSNFHDQRFVDLWTGHWQQHKVSQSEADVALCCALAPKLKKDPAAIDRVFRCSHLMRPKWDESRPGATYGSITVKRALEYLSRPFVVHDRNGDAPSIDGAGGTETKIEIGCEDVSNARRFVAQHRDDVRFACERKMWLVWDGRRWKADQAGRIMELAKQTADSIYAEAARLGGKKGLQRFKWALRSHSRERLNAMIALAQSDPAIVVTEDQLDTQDFLFNCLNGTVDLRVGQLRDHAKEDLLTKISGAAYDPEADCPQWRKFLIDCFDQDQELVDFVQRCCGYWLTGSTREQCWMFSYGFGSNGKSTFLNVIGSIFGDYCVAANFESFAFKRDGHGPRNDLASFVGARLITAVETTAGQRLDDSVIKNLTGGDSKLTARFLFREFFTYRPTFKICIAGNAKPAIHDASYAMWRRIRLIPFLHTFRGDEIIENLAELMLAEERDGVLAWSVEGCRLWQDKKLSPPAAVLSATAQYRREQDLVAQFIGERCNQGDSLRVDSKTLFGAYKSWAEDEGLRSAGTKTSFTQELTRLGFPLDRSRVKYLGLELAIPRSEHSDDDGFQF